MPKFYVESGDLLKVVDADNPIDACKKAIKISVKELMSDDSKDVDLGLLFVVSEKGFPSLREPFTIDTASETVVDTEQILDSM